MSHVPAIGGARQAPLQLSPDVPARALGLYTSHYFEGTELEAAESMPQAAFLPTARTEPDFGFRRHGIWLRMPIENSSSGAQDRVLLLGTNFMTELDVWLEHAGVLQPVLSQSSRHVFATREIAYHQLAAPLVIPPGGSTIYIRYRSDGSSALPIAIETGRSFVSVATRTVAIDFSFHAVVLIGVIAGLGSSLLFPKRVFLAYGLHALAILLFVTQREGYAFQYLWPERPVWNEFSSLPLGSALVLTGALFTRSFLETRAFAPRADLVLRLLILGQVALVASAIAVDVRLLKQLAILSVAGAALLFLGLGLAAVVQRGRRFLFYVLGWFGFVAATLATMAASFLGVPLTREATLDIIRGAMVFDLAMMGMAVFTGVMALRADRDRAAQARLQTLDQNMNLLRRLERLERNAEVARTMAAANARLMADTSHDLRQPIYALKAAVGALSAEANPEQVRGVEQSLAYMEDLVEALLDAPVEPEPASPTQEIIDARLILGTLGAVHAPDASSRGVDLRIVPSGGALHADPLAIIRILGNFLANALVHADGRPVLVGVRHKPDHLLFEVHDQGPGMTAETLERVRARGARGLDSSRQAPAGKGLGLSIVATVAAEAGLQWSIDSWPGRGTVARLRVPRAAEAEATLRTGG